MFSVTGHGDVATVDLQKRTFTCRIFYLDKIPCPHAMSAIRSQHSDDFGNYIYLHSSPYYSVQKYIIAYCQEIHPLSTEDSWIVPLDIIQREMPTPYANPSKPGRRTYERRRRVGESFSTRKNKCSVCTNFGHKKSYMPKSKCLIRCAKFNECSFYLRIISII